MNISDVTDGAGRKHRVIQDGGLSIVVGPHDEVVDALNLPPEIATRLHNALHARGIFGYADASRKSPELLAAMQETLLLDVQKLMEAFYKFDQEATK
jgi:hypothetical protein